MALTEGSTSGIDWDSIYKLVDIAAHSAIARAAIVFLVLSSVAIRFFPKNQPRVKLLVFFILLGLGIWLLGVSYLEADAQLKNKDVHVSRNDLPPNAVTCLTDKSKGEIIPAGARVCVTLHGSWFGPWGFAVSPLGDLRSHPPTYANHTTVWTIDAHTQGGRTSESRYIHPNEFVESVPYAVCVKPPDHAQTNPDDRVALDIQATDKPHCTTPAAQ